MPPLPDALERAGIPVCDSLGRHITPDLLPQGCVRCRSDTRQASEFQLQPDAGVLGSIVIADVAAHSEARPPAARTILEAGETLQESDQRHRYRHAVLRGARLDHLLQVVLVVAQRIDSPGEHVPVAPDRPGARGLYLVEGVTFVAVGEVHD